MINTAKCLYCGLELPQPCKTADAAEDCTRKPCEDPEEFRRQWFEMTGEL